MVNNKTFVVRIFDELLYYDLVRMPIMLGSKVVNMGLLIKYDCRNVTVLAKLYRVAQIELSSSSLIYTAGWIHDSIHDNCFVVTICHKIRAWKQIFI